MKPIKVRVPVGSKYARRILNPSSPLVVAFELHLVPVMAGGRPPKLIKEDIAEALRRGPLKHSELITAFPHVSASTVKRRLAEAMAAREVCHDGLLYSVNP